MFGLEKGFKTPDVNVVFRSITKRSLGIVNSNMVICYNISADLENLLRKNKYDILNTL